MIGETAALAAAACWAVGSHLFGRIGKGGVPAGAMNMGKCASATVLFAATVAATTGRLLPDAPARALSLLAISGVIGLALGDTAYFGAILTIGVRRALLLLSTAPVYAAIGGALFLDERMSLADGAAVAAVLAGVALVVLDRTRDTLGPLEALSAGELAAGDLLAEAAAGPGAPAAASAARPRTHAPPGVSAIGVALGITAGVGQAAGSLISRRAMQLGVGATDAAFIRIAAGTVGIVGLALALGRLGDWTQPLRRARTLGAVAGSSTIGTFLGIGLAQYAIGHARSTAIATTLLATSPIFALPIGHWIGGERVGARAVVGTLVACAGLAALTLR